MLVDMFLNRLKLDLLRLIKFLRSISILIRRFLISIIVLLYSEIIC